MTQYLNQKVKKEIREAIKIGVEKKIQKSSAHKELQSLTKQLIKGIRTAAKQRCPDTDIKVLGKYGLTVNHTELKVIMDSNHKLMVPIWHQKVGAYTLILDPPIITEYNNNNTHHLFKLIEADEELEELCKTAYKIHDHLECETNETVAAYMNRVDSFKTVKTLLNSHPSMQKFIPKKKQPIPVKTENEVDKLINRFEES